MANSTKNTAAKKSMGPKREGQNQCPMVTCDLDEFEGEVTRKKHDLLPFGVASALQSGNGAKLVEFLAKYTPESAEAVEDLAGDEVEGFMRARSGASGVSTGE